MSKHKTVEEWKAEWVWPEESDTVVNRYAQFRHEFLLEGPLSNEEPGDAFLHISVDTDYAVA